MQTYFAPAERANDSTIKQEIELLSHNPVVNTILQAVSGLIAVLNEQRQVISVNTAFLDMLGIREAGEVFGLRLGEMLQCIHANDLPGGCGTSNYCSTCGVVIAILSALVEDKAVERKCVASIVQAGQHYDLCLNAKATPITISGRKFILLFMEDLTIQEQRAALERTFFHDISNVITGLLGASSMMQYKDEHGRLVLSQQIQNLIERLSREVEIQRCLNRQNTPIYQVSRRDIRLGLIIEEIENLMCHHPLGRDKFLIVNNPDPSQTIQSDQTFLLRILTNMILNAFEASNKGDEVRLMIEADSQATTFSVWNPTAIPEDIGRRIFQRYFTTKPGAGRGLGTYTMKLLGEVYLGGEVAFHTSEMAGTTFWLKLPVASSPAEEARPIAS